jgi:hypothetical protein
MIRVLNGGKPIATHAKDYRRSANISASLSYGQRIARSGAIHYAAKAIGKVCSLEDAHATIDAVIDEFVRADATGRGIVDQAARERCKALAAQLPEPPSAA